MQFALSDLIVDEALFVEISIAFNENVCVPIYRNGAEFGLQHDTTEILGNLNQLCDVHKSLHHALKNMQNDEPNAICDIFERYCDELHKIDLNLMERIYAQIEEIFELSYNSNIINMMRKLNFEHNFNDISATSNLSYYKEEPQFIAYMVYLCTRIYRYIDHYHIPSLTKLKSKCMKFYQQIDCALYLLCLQSQITQCPISLFMKNRVLIRLEKLNMEAGKFKKKQKKRLLILFNDRILWCSILQNTTKKGEKYKYKGWYKIKDDNFEIKPFYYDANDQNHETYDGYDNESMSLHLGIAPVLNQHFGFKFGLRGNEKSFKIIVCSESQQQFWCKDINKYIVASAANLNTNNINLQSIDLFERFLKHSTSWNSDKIWHKMFDSKTGQKSLLSMILSLFYDLVKSNAKSTVHPPPIPSTTRSVDDAGGVTKGKTEEEDDVALADEEDISTSLSETQTENESVSNQSHRSSMHDIEEEEEDWNENKILKEELEEMKKELNKFKNDYKILENENAKLSSRNAFLNHRVTVFNEMFSQSYIERSRTQNVDDGYEENAYDEDAEDNDAAKYMKMISHKRKNSDSTLFNKSPSFLSTVKDEHTQAENEMDKKEEFYLNKKKKEKVMHSSKSRDEIVYRHKKKPKKKAKYRKARKYTKRIKTKISDDESTQSNDSRY